jgi:hypothetical protein
MDFNKKWGKNKSFGDLLGEIYDNAKKKEKQINDLIKELQPMIKEPGDAMLLVPLLKEYLELGIKNDEHLIKMAGIIQKSIDNKEDKNDDALSAEEIEQLYNAAKKLEVNRK